ncbi:hypothetical protein FQZ97_1109010 [compost metagenome]
MSQYDFDKKGFAYTPGGFGGATDRGYIGWADNLNYKVAFSNGSEFKFIKVEDESTARELESVIQKPGHRLSVTIYGYVDSVQVGRMKKSDEEMMSMITIQRLDVADAANPTNIIVSVTN